ncbi:ankyrin [Colletotrichum zoysiae]|uniref:Ankyrin n=1 Tax=Colletotrichum zoysiae TaxID=1216348 RepID=A0AAD9M9G2_9PEZI|nr:ankyrin [Colletotrichum zoysiae]
MPAGPTRYLINFACWACSSDVVQGILDRKIHTNVSDDFSRRPIHFACYNSLAVFDLLVDQDEDLTAVDSTGRLPLHFAVLSGQMALVKEVLLRSERVGIDINIVDKNNWTPLMWAARASRLFDRPQDEVVQDESVISFLLEKGADKQLLGDGFNRKWSALQIAQYHQDEKICYLAKSMFHSQHEFNDCGSELYSSHDVTEKAISVKSGSENGELRDEGEITKEFDDEILDEENLVHTEDTV